MTIETKSIVEAMNLFANKIFNKNNLHVVHLNLRTVQLKNNVSGPAAIILNEMLQIDLNHRIIKFKVEELND